MTSDLLPWTVWVDHPVTRRKRYHVLTDQTGAVRYTALRLSRVLEYLAANAIDCYELRSDPQDRTQPITLIAQTKET